MPRPRRRATLDGSLLYLLALTLPFPLLGVALNDDYVLSVSSLAGLAFAMKRIARSGFGRLHLAALVMLLAFAATAIARLPPTTYLLSLGALALALAPLTVPVLSERDLRSLVPGLLLGCKLTLFCVAAAILIQLGGAGGGGGLEGLFVRPEMGSFLGYVRPAAGFTEPSHLAIYLTTVYVALDQLRKAGRYRGRLGPFILGAVFFTGSLSGLLLIFVYIAAKLVFGLRASSIRGVSARELAKRFAMGAALVVVLVVAGSSVLDFADEYVSRIVKTQDDIETLNLVGSEGSRVNAVAALPDYWAEEGWTGLLFGTGYANYRDWLVRTYGYLGEWSTFGRGQIDNILVAVTLSTGLFGLSAYLAFLAKAFGWRVIRREVPLVIFVLAFDFSFGFLISGLYWNLLFVIAALARHAALQTAPARAARSGERRALRARPAPAVPSRPASAESQ